ncbi:MAG: hypothetical protein IT313_09810 [Anaerolineales bacterium]|nr:hypothetical protein [Anaerolineales bacterium]
MNQEKFRIALGDVVWRYHVYGQYEKKPEKAIKALMRRAPGRKPEFYQEMFELDLRLLISTIKAVGSAPKYIKPKQTYSEFSDVDMNYVIRMLQTAFPNLTNEHLEHHVGMVIYWYYLR